MYLRIFIATYKNDQLLSACLDSIYACFLPNDEWKYDVYVLNNYGTMTRNINGKEYPESLRIINNEARPDFSTGHLSRTWNQAFMIGFEDPTAPACDAVVLIQNDAEITPDFFLNLQEPVRQFNYICLGKGDEVQIVQPEALHRIGMYDELICNIGYHEGDYLLRALLFNAEKSSITDHLHSRLLNPLDNSHFLKPTPNSAKRNDEELHRRIPQFELQHKIWQAKWGNIGDTRWDIMKLLGAKEDIKPHIKQHIFYPYFELKLQRLEEKYVVF